MAHLRKARLGCCLFVLLVITSTASAQLVGGAIQGTVKDAQGAVLPGASVVVRNAGTGALFEQVTDQTGHYQVLAWRRVITKSPSR